MKASTCPHGQSDFLVNWSNFGWMPFLTPPVTPRNWTQVHGVWRSDSLGVMGRFTGCEGWVHRVWRMGSLSVKVQWATTASWHLHLPFWSINLCSLSILTVIFSGGPGLAGTSKSQFWTLLEIRMTEVVSGNNWSYKTCKAPVKSSPPAHQHPSFYRLDVLPVAQPTASEHWSYLLTYCRPHHCWTKRKIESFNLIRHLVLPRTIL